MTLACVEILYISALVLVLTKAYRWRKVDVGQYVLVSVHTPLFSAWNTSHVRNTNVIFFRVFRMYFFVHVGRLGVILC